MLANRAYIELVLEGVPLPATPDDLARYAQREGEPGVASILSGLSGERYGSIDEVGEELEPVQPRREPPRRRPRAESDLPPGGAAYGQPVRDDEIGES